MVLPAAEAAVVMRGEGATAPVGSCLHEARSVAEPYHPAVAIVRLAERADVPRLRELMLAYIVDFYGRPAPDEDDLASLIEMLLEGREGVQLVAEDDGDPVGFATLYFTWRTLRPGRTAIMNDLFVEEGARGTGVAADLLEACKAEAKRRGCLSLTWETAPDNHRAQRFYERMGGMREDWVPYSVEL